MKCLHVIASLDPARGGPSEGLRNLVPASAELGMRIELATLDAPDAPWLASYGTTVHAFGPSAGVYAYTARLVPWLRRHAGEYDAVFVNGLWDYAGFGTWRALRGAATPYFVFPHGMLDPWFKHAYPAKHLKKWLYWPWGQYPVLRDARAVLFTCEQERLLARESFWLYRCREDVVGFGAARPPHDADAQRARFLDAWPRLRGRRVLLFLGRIHPKKGCDLLLQAFARVCADHPDLDLVMAGPDQTGWRPELERMAEGLGIAGRVCWTGMLGGDLKWGALYAAEAFVLPSHQENFGVAVAEALACATPVLISDRVNICHEIAADGAGLVAGDDVDGTVALLRDWLALDGARRDAMRAAARRSFTERFEIGALAARLVALVRGAAGNRGAS